MLSIISWWCVTYEEGFCDTYLNLLPWQISVTNFKKFSLNSLFNHKTIQKLLQLNPLKKSSELQTNEIALSVKSESHVALDSLRPNTTPTRDLTLHWSWIHFSAEHKRRTNSFKPLLLHFCRVTLMGLNCSRQLVYNWNLRWSSANSFAIIRLHRFPPYKWIKFLSLRKKTSQH